MCHCSVDLGSSEEQVQDGHADMHAVGDLLHDDGSRTVGDLRRDLHAAVHRTRMQHDAVVGKQSGAAYVEPVSAGVLIARREVRGIHPLGLHAQHHHRVGSRKCVVEVVGDRARPSVDANGHERGWGHQRHLGTEGVEKQDI